MTPQDRPAPDRHPADPRSPAGGTPVPDAGSDHLRATVRAAVRDAARYAEHWLSVQQRVHRVPGVQAAVAVDGEVVLSRAYGHADLATRAPLTTQHLFRVASHSKTFTATLVLQLVESGRVRLDDRADAWLEHLAGSPLGAVTLRDLLGHGAGVSRDSEDGDFWQLLGPFPDHDLLRELTRTGADVLPVAERFKYSNLGYGLLGLVVESATGRTYAELLAESITGPLGLHRTGADWTEAEATAFATGHTGAATARPGAEPLPIGAVPTGALAPATGVYSTAEDLVRFAAAHYVGDTRLLPDPAKRRMQHPEWTAVRPDEDYALGLVVATIDGRRTVGHSGGFPGYLTRTLWDPADRFAVSVLTNAIDGPATALATAVVRLVGLALAAPPGAPLPEGSGAGRDRSGERLGDRPGAAHHEHAEPAMAGGTNGSGGGTPDAPGCGSGAVGSGPGTSPSSSAPPAGVTGAPADPPDLADPLQLDRFTGHFANLWGLLDVVRLGSRLYAIDPTAPDPTTTPVHLTPEDASTLRIGGGTGYGSPGEAFRYTWAEDGSVRSVRAGSGQTMYPAESYLEALAGHREVTGPVHPG